MSPKPGSGEAGGVSGGVPVSGRARRGTGAAGRAAGHPPAGSRSGRWAAAATPAARRRSRSPPQAADVLCDPETSFWRARMNGLARIHV